MQMTRQQPTFTLGLISDGPRGIWETLKIMSSFVRAGKKTSAVRTMAQTITQSLPQKDYSGEVRLIHAYVRDRIRYVGDITDVETIQTPEITLQLLSGDCDDKAILLCALLESINHPTRFKAIGFEPNVYEHVYVETLIGTNWIPLETTEEVEVGWEPPADEIRARMLWVN
jgi:hypothetical protein